MKFGGNVKETGFRHGRGPGGTARWQPDGGPGLSSQEDSEERGEAAAAMSRRFGKKTPRAKPSASWDSPSCASSEIATTTGPGCDRNRWRSSHNSLIVGQPPFLDQARAAASVSRDQESSRWDPSHRTMSHSDSKRKAQRSKGDCPALRSATHRESRDLHELPGALARYFSVRRPFEADHVPEPSNESFISNVRSAFSLRTACPGLTYRLGDIQFPTSFRSTGLRGRRFQAMSAITISRVASSAVRNQRRRVFVVATMESRLTGRRLRTTEEWLLRPPDTLSAKGKDNGSANSHSRSRGSGPPDVPEHRSGTWHQTPAGSPVLHISPGPTGGIRRSASAEKVSAGVTRGPGTMSSSWGTAPAFRPKEMED